MTNSDLVVKKEDDLNTPVQQWAVTRGEPVWIPHAEQMFVKSIVYQIDDEKDEIETEGGKFKRAEVFPINPDGVKGAKDNTMLMYLYDANLLENLKYRYSQDAIYTNTAHILIAINPYKRLPIYEQEAIKQYHKSSMSGMEPHVFATAERAYRHLRSAKNGQSQSIVVSGDSGAGKTETCKYILRYLTAIAGRNEGQGTLEKQILEANPILEAFGNAKTLRNINSSRFGKFVEVYFDDENFVAGAGITTYLLEKSRLVSQQKGERNYHIFYQMISGATDEERARWFLPNDPNAFEFLNKSGTTTIDGVDDSADFAHVRSAMTLCQIDDEQQENIFGLLSGLLHLGNIKFTTKTGVGQEENATIDPVSKESVAAAATLLNCDETPMTYSLVTRTMRVSSRGTVYTIPLKVSEAIAARDAIAKQLYSRLFDWLVAHINKGIPKKAGADRFIGLLDISGFEYFEKNSFEQFLINYCNERIQQYFVSQTIEAEQHLYLQEGLRWRKVEYTDNAETLELIDSRGDGIFSLMEEQCVLARADDVSFTTQLHKSKVGHVSLLAPNAKVPGIKGLGRRYRMDEAFVVRHFAADVCYNTTGFLEKNNDTLHGDLITLMRASQSKFVKGLFAESFEGGEKRTRNATITSNFYEGIGVLMKRLNSTTSHFIRCINPNAAAIPNKIDNNAVITQLRCSGMLEALRIMQAGFPTRCFFTDLYAKYRDEVPKELRALKPILFCEALLVALDLEGGKDFQMGLSRVFFRSGKLAFMDDLMNGNLQHTQAIIEKVRLWLAKKRWKQAISAVISINLFGKIIEDIREERRRKEELRRMQDATYQAEVRRKEELERKRLEEERKKKEEEARKVREEEEQRRQEKLAKKRAHEEEVRTLRLQAAEKMTLEARLDEQQKAYEELEKEMDNDIKTLEVQLNESKDSGADLESRLLQEQSNREVAEQKNKMQEDEIARLRKRINELEQDLDDANRKNDLLTNKLYEERRQHTEESRQLQDDLLELARVRDEEVSAAQRKCDETIARIRTAKQEEMERIRQDADETYRTLANEKRTAITLERELKQAAIEQKQREMDELECDLGDVIVEKEVEIESIKKEADDNIRYEQKQAAEEKERAALEVETVKRQADVKIKTVASMAQEAIDTIKTEKEEQLRYAAEREALAAREAARDVADVKMQADVKIKTVAAKAHEAIESVKAEKEQQLRDLEKTKQQEMEAAIRREQEEKMAHVQRIETLAVAPMKTGWLDRKAKKNGKYERRFFVLKSNFLRYYKDAKAHETHPSNPKGTIDLEKCRVYKTESGGDVPANKKKKAEEFSFEVQADQTFFCRAESARARDEWIRALNLAKARYLRSGVVNLDQTSVRDVQRQSVMISPRKK
eukprot:TRINITY_DN517_c0_g1_i4.p1 TRINITY_DN517_c0_g1~~TRINITY_DN517_c0_g1_i4.p1  ORF type:complete len:1377 (+),score=632.44 TRINITY_DN517_c0_g1_i4:234-4364(+)